MKAVSVLIKPASGLCNLKCKYCFYMDEVDKRQSKCLDIMDSHTRINLIRRFLEIPDLTHITFAFQGGEPTLAGLDYFKSFVREVSRYNEADVNVYYSLQTNATLLNDEFAKFLKDNNFLVGVSLDGIKETHDLYRKDKKGNDTFDLVLNNITLLKKYDVEFNILTVLTKDLVGKIEDIYSFYKAEGLLYQQYIPCLDPLEAKRGGEVYSLTPNDLEFFLNKLFDLYYNDIINGNFVSNRFFENYIGILLGNPPESCAMAGRCSIQYVIEANGDCYPCDFYAIDSHYLGNINTSFIYNIDLRRDSIGFIECSLKLEEKCLACKYLKLCRGGCKRDKEMNGNININYYCDAFYSFLDKNLDRLKHIAGMVRLGTFPMPK